MHNGDADALLTVLYKDRFTGYNGIGPNSTDD